MSDNGSKTVCIARIAKNIVPTLVATNDTTSCMDMQGTPPVSETCFLKDKAHIGQTPFQGVAAVYLWFVRMFKGTKMRPAGAIDVFNLSLQPQRT